MKPLIGKTVAITVTEIDAGAPECVKQLQHAAPLDLAALAALRDHLTAEQYAALEAIATAGGPDAEAICRLRAASKI